MMSLSPAYGPRSGRTLITLTGTELLAGNRQQVFFNSNLTCDIAWSVLVLSYLLYLRRF